MRLLAATVLLALTAPPASASPCGPAELHGASEGAPVPEALEPALEWSSRIDVRLAKRLAASEASGDASAVRIRVRLAPGDSAQAARDRMAALAGVRVVAANEGVVPSLLLEADARGVDALARRADVLAIDDAPLPRTHVDDAIWYLQSGNQDVRSSNYAISAPLFARGLTGRGLLLALADDGLENDECRFVYRTGVNEAAWALGPSADSAAPVPDEESLSPAGPVLRTRERKVVAYYLQAGATAFVTEQQHGTMVAGIATGDSNVSLAARPLVRDLGLGQDVAPQRAGGDWSLGQELRPDLLAAGRVDDVTADDPALPNTYGSLIEHHQPGDGIAPGAQVVVQDIGDGTGALTGTPTVEQMLRQASGTGATTWVGTWGLEGCMNCYDTEAAGTDAALWRLRDLVAVDSAGNDGLLGVSGGHAQAKSIVTVGAGTRAIDPSCPPCAVPTSRVGEAIAPYSNHGDGVLMKPLLVAPGNQMSPHADVFPDPENGAGTGDFGCAGSPVSRVIAGTSFSAASVAGLSLLVQQYFLDGFYPSGAPDASFALRPTNALVRAVLVNSARDMHGARTGDLAAGQAPRPSGPQGWGTPTLDDTLYFTGDPKRAPDGSTTERRRFIVLNDSPNGYDGTAPLAPEPGGRTRDRIVGFRPALSGGETHEYFVRVTSPDSASPDSELRVTLSWSDYESCPQSNALVNDVDLEVISPGPDGILQTRAMTLAGDDVLYRTNPSTQWEGGFTVPSAATSLLAGGPAEGADTVNTTENVFVPPPAVVPGTWRIRVIGTAVRSSGTILDGRPNLARDQAPTLDTDGDGVADLDEHDTLDASRQGYALIASGPVTAMRTPPVGLPPRGGPGRGGAMPPRGR